MPILPTTLLILLAVPFDSLWPEFEAARRGVLLVVTGLICCTLPRTWPRTIPRGAILLACFCLWQLLRTFDVTNPGEAWLRAAHILAVAVWFLWGAVQVDMGAGLRTILPATLMVSVYGLAQGLGLHWPDGYAGTGEAVSSLGNRNVAAEFAALGLVAAAVIAVRGEGRRLALVTIFFASAYLIVNGSRGGMVAAALGIGLALAEKAGAVGKYRSPALVGLGLGIALGVLLPRDGVEIEPEVPTAAASLAPVDTLRLSTLAVRKEIWKSAVSMFDAAPVLGQGTGQFRYLYPQFRSQEEIEISSFGRRFHVFVDTAHNDFIEVLIETGLPGLATLLCFFFVVLVPQLRHGKTLTRSSLANLAVPTAFLALALVRSPLGNAPVAAFAFFACGILVRTDRAAEGSAPRYRWIAIPAGLLLAWSGLSLLVAEHSMAEYGRHGELADLDRAIAYQPSESRWRSFRIRHLKNAGAADMAKTYQSVRDDLEEIAAIDPWNTTALLLRAEISKQAGDFATTQNALAELLRLDSGNPEATLLTAVLLIEEGVKRGQLGLVERGVATLYARPHPRLREQLSMHLNSLRAVAQTGSDAKAERLLIRERDFIRALDSVILDAGSKQSAELVATYGKSVGAHEGRFRVLVAYRLLQSGASVEELTSLVPKLEHVPGKAAQRLLADLLPALRANPAWRHSLSFR